MPNWAAACMVHAVRIEDFDRRTRQYEKYRLKNKKIPHTEHIDNYSYVTDNYFLNIYIWLG